MKKLYFLFMAMLLSFAASASSVYLRGNIDSWKDWTTGKEFVYAGNDVYYLDYGKIETEGSFKIVIDDSWYGNGGTLDKESKFMLPSYSGSDNIKISTAIDNARFVFIMDSNSGGKGYLYLVDAENSYAIHRQWVASNKDNWGSTDMTETNGVWSLLAPDCEAETMFGIIEYDKFTKKQIGWISAATSDDVNIKIGETKQASTGGTNFTLGSAGNIIFTFNPATMQVSITEPEPFVVYFEKPSSWSQANIWAYVSGGEGEDFCNEATGWPGDTMTSALSIRDSAICSWSTTKGTPTRFIFSDSGSNKIDVFKNESNEYTFESGHLFTTTSYSAEVFDPTAYNYGNTYYVKGANSAGTISAIVALTAVEGGNVAVQVNYTTELNITSAEVELLWNDGTEHPQWVNLTKSADNTYSATSSGVQYYFRDKFPNIVVRTNGADNDFTIAANYEYGLANEAIVPPTLTLTAALANNDSEIEFSVEKANFDGSYTVNIISDDDIYNDVTSPWSIPDTYTGATTFTIQAIGTTTDGATVKSNEVSLTIIPIAIQTFSGTAQQTFKVGEKEYPITIDYAISNTADGNLKVTAKFTVDFASGFAAPRMVVSYNGANTGVIYLNESTSNNARALAEASSTTQTKTYSAETTDLNLKDGDTLGVTISYSYTGGFSDYTVDEYTSYGKSGMSSVKGIAIDNDDAPVEYYNLQGVKVIGEPAPGLYIRRQGNKASKVVIR